MYQIDKVPMPNEEVNVPNAINVIASFDARGNILPIYVRLKDHDAIKIERVVSSRHIKYAGLNTIEYRIIYRDEDYEREAKIHYYIGPHTWGLPPMPM